MAMGAAVRRMHAAAAAAAAAQPPRLTKLALHPPRSVEVEFTDGSSFHLSAEFLRVHSPAADSKIISVSGEKVIFGRRYVGIMSAELVGNYGIRILFDDLHKTGIFTWDYLHHLGSKKFSLTRNYIRTLRKHGLSRDPQRRK
uniref:Gamma-butyrobetaine hydroxylase-like N-terminal domain-containing protein n=1 Tax=Oryza glumipatula TaxID=40148 RepID=A0A0D9YIT8_9ORYZ